jgi:hypothetical protein
MKSFKDFLSIKDDKKRPLPTPAWEMVRKYKEDPSVFITFTKIHKVGVNPNSGYSTVLGVYAYPLQETYDLYRVDEEKGFSAYPFPDDVDKIYVAIIKLKDPNDPHFVQDFVGQYVDRMYLEDKAKLKEIYLENELHETTIHLEDHASPKKYSFEEFCKYTDTTAAIEGESSDEPAARMWNLTRNMGIAMTIAHKSTSSNNPNKARYTRAALKWNTILRTLHYHGFADFGWGLLHPNEPVQAVHLSMKHIEVIDILPNTNYIELSEDEKDLLGHTPDFAYYTDETTQKLAKNTLKFVNQNFEALDWIRTYKGLKLDFERTGGSHSVIVSDGQVAKERIRSGSTPFRFCFYRINFDNTEFDFHSNKFHGCQLKDCNVNSIDANTSVFDNCEVKGINAPDMPVMLDGICKNNTKLHNFRIAGYFKGDGTVNIYDCEVKHSDVDLNQAMFSTLSRSKVKLNQADHCTFRDCYQTNEEAQFISCTIELTDITYLQKFRGKVTHGVKYVFKEAALDIFEHKMPEELRFDSVYSPDDVMKVINTRRGEMGKEDYTLLFEDAEEFFAVLKDFHGRHILHYDKNEQEDKD